MYKCMYYYKPTYVLGNMYILNIVYLRAVCIYLYRRVFILILIIEYCENKSLKKNRNTNEKKIAIESTHKPK